MERRSEYMVLRNVFSFCLWDIPAAVLLLALMIFFIWRHYKYKEQIRIAKEILHSRNHAADIKKLVKGLMIESYIEEGNQKIGAGCYGKSITDPCLSWNDSEKLLYEIAEQA